MFSQQVIGILLLQGSAANVNDVLTKYTVPLFHFVKILAMEMSCTHNQLVHERWFLCLQVSNGSAMN